MKKIICGLVALFFCATLSAQNEMQNIPVDTTKYVGYQPTWNPDNRLMQPNGNSHNAKKGAKKQAKDAVALPDHWNSAESKHFPPIMNQGSFGSCGVSSHVGYMMTHGLATFWAAFAARAPKSVVLN